jgi:hypothetical protein
MANDSSKTPTFEEVRKARQAQYLAWKRKEWETFYDASNEPGISQVFLPVNPLEYMVGGAVGGAAVALAARNIGRGATLIGRKAMTKTPKQVAIAEFKAARQAARDSTALIPYVGTGATMTEPWLVSGTRRTVHWAGQKLARTPAAMGVMARKGGHAFESVDSAMMKAGSMLFGVERNVNLNRLLTVRQSMAANLGWAATVAVGGAAVGGAIDGVRAFKRRSVDAETEENRKAYTTLSPKQYQDERTALNYLFNPANGVYTQYVALSRSNNPHDVQARDKLLENARGVYDSPWIDHALSQAFAAYYRDLERRSDEGVRDIKGQFLTREALEKRALDEFYGTDISVQLGYVKSVLYGDGARFPAVNSFGER